MALPLYLGLPQSFSPLISVHSKSPHSGHPFNSLPRFNFPTLICISRLRTRRSPFIINAIDDDGHQDSSSESDTVNTQQQQRQSPKNENTHTETNGEATELGSEIRKALKERGLGKESGDLWSGVAEEVGEIEWPAFGKVLGTTGVVLGVIAGSSVVLLTVNAILAELSDRFFAGGGVQDFFGS